MTEGDQAGGTIPAGGDATCIYRATPENETYRENTAQITAAGNPAFTAGATLEWTMTQIGPTETTLTDDIWNDGTLDLEKVIEAGGTDHLYTDVVCPLSSSGLYVNGVYAFSIPNWAYLDSEVPYLHLEDDATVDVTCTQVWASETATGAGTRYNKPPSDKNANWFMFTPFTTAKVDLIAGGGQYPKAGTYYDAGDIFMERVNGGTKITIILASGWRWANVTNNVKINPYTKATNNWVPPGSFKYKYTATTMTFVTNPIVPSTAGWFGIHCDVQRLVK